MVVRGWQGGESPALWYASKSGKHGYHDEVGRSGKGFTTAGVTDLNPFADAAAALLAALLADCTLRWHCFLHRILHNV